MSSWVPSLTGADGPLYRTIAGQLARAIAAGELAPGTRLPTQRDLALRLGISVQTVSQAYAEAERQGLVSGEVGRGTFVRPPPGELEPRFIMDRRSENVIDLSINRPVYEQIHSDRVQAGLAKLARADPAPMLVCRPIAGLEEHRRAGAVWLRQRGLEVPPERILITNGAAHGLMVALSVLSQPGDLVVTEQLVDHGIIGLADLLNVRLEGLPIDAEGIVPEGFEAACVRGGVKVLCTTPTLNNPTTALMGEARRRALAAIARRYGVFIIEDDVYGLLVPDGPPALSCFVPELACYVTSFTKTVVSGLRTGYLAVPDSLLARMIRRIRVTTWMATPLVADLATRWIQDGTALELTGWQRGALAARQALVAEVLGDFRPHHHPHGQHAWLELPEPWRAPIFIAEARLDKVAVTPAEPFVAGPAPAPHAIRVSVGAVRSVDELRRGLLVLADLLRREPEPFYLPT